MVPTVAESSQTGSKDSKAAMLTKTVDYCRQMRSENKKLQKETDKLRHEISDLTAEISEFQRTLPTAGVEFLKQNQSENVDGMFNDYVRARIFQNWKFWIFSMVAKPLFNSYNKKVATGNGEDFNKSVMSWIDKHCSLVALRPAMLNCLRELSTQTSVMSKPERLPEEALQAAMNEVLVYKSEPVNSEKDDGKMDTSDSSL